MNILVINAGSSSLKYQLFNMDNEEVIAKGLCERIGIDGHLKHKPYMGNKPICSEDLPLPTHSEAIAAVIDKLTSEKYGVLKSLDEISAVGHRVLHGGASFSSSMRITDEVMAAIEECIPLGPLHNPANIIGIRACADIMGENVPQIAVFDTAFHQTMPKQAYTYAIPYEYYEKYKIRRYGFHGTSHRFVAGRAAEFLGRPIDELKLISCHMGNGTSLAAVQNGKCIDTSMGFTPLAGTPMGTRCGDIDAAVVEFLMQHEGYDIGKMMNILNKESGVLGVSGISSDFRDVSSAAEAGNERAKLALSMFSYSVAKFIGAYTVAMGGLDALVFTAGIGENSPEIRSDICRQLTVLGAQLDEEKNNVKGKERDISTEDSRVRLLVIPTNEELVIARDTLEIVQ